MVHHNTVSLDKLVDQAWVEILTKYAVDEECDFLVRLFFILVECCECLFSCSEIVVNEGGRNAFHGKYVD